MKIVGKTSSLALSHVEPGVPFRFTDGAWGTFVRVSGESKDPTLIQVFNLDCGILSESDPGRGVQTFPDAFVTLTPETPGATHNLLAEIANFLQEEKKIQAIKRVRDFCGLELKEAKDLVDRMTWWNNRTRDQLVRQHAELLHALREDIKSRDEQIDRLQEEVADLRAQGYGDPNTIPLSDHAFKTDVAGEETYTLAGLIMVLVERSRGAVSLDAPVIFQTAEGPDTVESCEVQERKLAKSSNAHDCMLTDDKNEKLTEVITLG